jgi:hypothetical protein
MSNKFVKNCQILLKSFQETGNIEYLLYLESDLHEFLDETVEDYLEEKNDSYIDENTSFSSCFYFQWNSDSTL